MRKTAILINKPGCSGVYTKAVDQKYLPTEPFIETVKTQKIASALTLPQNRTYELPKPSLKSPHPNSSVLAGDCQEAGLSRFEA